MFLGKHQPVGGFVDSNPMCPGMQDGSMAMPDASGYAYAARCGYEVGGYAGPGMVESEFDLDIQPRSQQKIYVVRKGDTVYKIAKKYDLDWRELAGYNHLANPNLIYPGQRLVIPTPY